MSIFGYTKNDGIEEGVASCLAGPPLDEKAPRDGTKVLMWWKEDRSDAQVVRWFEGLLFSGGWVSSVDTLTAREDGVGWARLNIFQDCQDYDKDPLKIALDKTLEKLGSKNHER